MAKDKNRQASLLPSRLRAFNEAAQFSCSLIKEAFAPIALRNPYPISSYRI
jgi:hypothetical protein